MQSAFPESRRSISRSVGVHLTFNLRAEVPPSATREEMRTFARGEFERNKFVYDLGHIRYLISTGKTQFDSMRRYVEQGAS